MKSEEGLLSTGQLSHKIGLTLQGKFIGEELGIAPTLKTRVGQYWRPDLATNICLALASWAQERAVNLARVAPAAAPQTHKAASLSLSSWVSHSGISQTIRSWSMVTGIPANIIRERLKRGWATHDALTRAVRRYERKIGQGRLL